MKLKLFRILAASVVITIFTAALFLSLDLLNRAVSLMAGVQLIPALYGAAGGAGLFLQVAILLGLALFIVLTGRLYCSIICPLGIIQDGITFLSGRTKGRKFRFRKSTIWVQLALLIVLMAAFVIGNGLIAGYLEPYSISGRFLGALLRPLLLWVNNLLAGLLSIIKVRALLPVEFEPPTIPVLSGTLILFVTVGVMAFTRGRLYCNLLCPVGALLRLTSRLAIFKIDLNHESCNSCGLCEKSCKAECIDSAKRRVESERCVSCFNCLTVCPKSALSYAPSLRANVDAERRSFFLKMRGAGAGALLLSLFPLRQLAAKGAPFKDKMGPVTVPPGAKGVEQFYGSCSRCHLCIASCPTGVIQPAHAPYLDYEKSYCEYECNLCSQLCPTNAIAPTSLAEKQLIQLGEVEFIKKECIVYKSNTSCGACSEHCPTKAVYMVPYEPEVVTANMGEELLFIPELDSSLCVGCGICQMVCPAEPTKAITVKPHRVHKSARLPESKVNGKRPRELTPEESREDFPF